MSRSVRGRGRSTQSDGRTDLARDAGDAAPHLHLAVRSSPWPCQSVCTTQPALAQSASIYTSHRPPEQEPHLSAYHLRASSMISLSTENHAFSTSLHTAARLSELICLTWRSNAAEMGR